MPTFPYDPKQKSVLPEFPLIFQTFDAGSASRLPPTFLFSLAALRTLFLVRSRCLACGNELINLFLLLLNSLNMVAIQHSLIFNGPCTQYKNLQEIVKPNY